MLPLFIEIRPGRNIFQSRNLLNSGDTGRHQRHLCDLVLIRGEFIKILLCNSALRIEGEEMHEISWSMALVCMSFFGGQ